ncbi:hypothetical protein GGI12_002853 [Dipsacomyces acuminosporus]|nr:hypothetical protein GGI12_002853 [Dipsacomyces acuminosporus]
MSWLFSMRRRGGAQKKANESKVPTAEDTALIREEPASDENSKNDSSISRAGGNEKLAAQPPPGLLEEYVDDVDGLFAKLSIVEIRQYQQLLQGHIENTQRQMRKVAGEHYPDLIDAADSVVAMDISSASISMRLSSLKSMLEDTKSAISLRPDTAISEPKNEAASVNGQQGQDSLQTKIYSIAAQVKVLVDTPEQIWKALESKQFLQATLLYLIACEIRGKLCEQSRLSSPFTNQDPPGSAAFDEGNVVDPLLAFPVIERQWLSIAPFREQIVSKAHQLLASTEDVPIRALMSSICAIALLEDVDAETACTIFLSRRGDSLKPQLDSIATEFDSTEDSIGQLDTVVQELLGRIRQVLADYVLIFGIPDDFGIEHATASMHHRQKAYASWILTTLASISADADLPMPPSLRPFWKDRSVGQQNLSAASQPRSIEASQKLKPEAAGLKLRRRKSSIAGSVISSAISGSPIPRAASGISHSHTTSSPSIALTGSRINSELSPPWTPSVNRPAHASSVFMIAKYLPEDIAQFKPPLPRILDSNMVQPDSDALNEADEDMVGLDHYIKDPDALFRALSVQVQPCLERIAKHALGIWWKDTIASVQASVSAAIAGQVLSVADAAHIGSSIYKWEMASTMDWTRGLSWTAIESNSMLLGEACAGSLYGSVLEPLLQERARKLQFAAVDQALSLPGLFLQSNDVSDIISGYLPWQPFSLDGSGMPAAAQELVGMNSSLSHLRTDSLSRTLPGLSKSTSSSSFSFTDKAVGDLAVGSGAMDRFIAEVQGGLEFMPETVRSFGDAVKGALQLAWRDGNVWWRQMSGAAALPEATICAKHFVSQWKAMSGHLTQWSADTIDLAMQAVAAGDYAASHSGSIEPDGGAGHMPGEVVRCIKGAWTMAVLVEVAHDVLATDTLLMRECWEQFGLSVDDLSQKLHTLSQDLLQPWFKYLGSSMAHAWAADFDALYYRIPQELQQDAGATHHDIVRAWLASSRYHQAARASAGLAAAGVWAARYAALRRIASTAAAAIEDETPGAQDSLVVSTQVQCLGMRLRAQIQAVGGLSSLVSDHGEMQRCIGQAFTELMQAAISAKRQETATAEWDGRQLAADIRYTLRNLGCKDLSTSLFPLQLS